MSRHLRKWVRRGLVVAVFVGTASSPLWWHSAGLAQDGQQQAQQKPAQAQGQQQPDARQLAEMMERYEQAAKPGEFHDHLKALEGQWAVTAEMMGPEGAMTSRGRAKNTWVLGGRFLRQEFSGDMMGRQFNGVGYTGYDNTAKQYQSVWMDEMSSGIFLTEGEFDEEGKVFTFTGQAADALTGEMKNYRHVIRIATNDQFVFEMYEPAAGGEMTKTTTLTYTRAE